MARRFVVSKVLEEAALRISESVGELRGVLGQSIKNQDEVNGRLTTMLEKQNEKIDAHDYRIVKIERRLLIALLLALCLFGDKLGTIITALPW